jgi:hypothetical protein
MSSSNFFSPRATHQLVHTPLWETAPALPTWLTATVPANCTHTYAGRPTTDVYELNIGTAAAVGTEVKVETSLLRSQHFTRFEVDHLRFDNAVESESDVEIYIAGATVGFRLQALASVGKTQGVFTGQAAEDAVSIELMKHGNGARVKCLGLELWPWEKTVHVLVDGEIHRTFVSPTWSTAATDLRAGFRLVKRGGSGAKWVRYGAIRLAIEN